MSISFELVQVGLKKLCNIYINTHKDIDFMMCNRSKKEWMETGSQMKKDSSSAL